MTLRIVSTFFAAGAFVGLLAQSGKVQQQHPDFSGIWQYSVDLPGTGVKQLVQGKVVTSAPDRSGRLAAKGARAWDERTYVTGVRKIWVVFGAIARLIRSVPARLLRPWSPAPLSMVWKASNVQ